MKFSVIIPAYNAAGHIRKALESIRSQTFTDYELIVVCDSCTDNTAEVASEYGAVILKCSERNDGRTRNHGLDIAKGDWVLFLDSDDWWLHEYVFEQLSRRTDQVRADVGVICFGIIWKHIGYTSPVTGGGSLYPHCTNKCWRRAFIGNERFPAGVRVSDAAFHEIMMARKPKIDIWEMPMYYYNFLRKGSESDLLGRTAAHTIDYWSRH